MPVARQLAPSRGGVPNRMPSSDLCSERSPSNQARMIPKLHRFDLQHCCLTFFYRGEVRCQLCLFEVEVEGAVDVLDSLHISQSGEVFVWHFGDLGNQLCFDGSALLLVSFVNERFGRNKRATYAYLLLWLLAVWKSSSTFPIRKSRPAVEWSWEMGGFKLWSLSLVRTYNVQKIGFCLSYIHHPLQELGTVQLCCKLPLWYPLVSL